MNQIFSSKLILSFSAVAIVLVIGAGAVFVLNQNSEPQEGTVLYPPQPTPSPSPTPTATPVAEVPDDWLTYRNEELGFEVKYPGNAEAVDLSLKDGDSIRIALPFEHDEISSKYFLIWARSHDLTECSKDYSFYSEVGERVAIAKREFFKEHSPETLASGVIADDRNYFGMQKDFCLYLTFGVEYRSEQRNWEDETEVFDQILSTFRFIE